MPEDRRERLLDKLRRISTNLRRQKRPVPQTAYIAPEDYRQLMREMLDEYLLPPGTYDATVAGIRIAPTDGVQEGEIVAVDRNYHFEPLTMQGNFTDQIQAYQWAFLNTTTNYDQRPTRARPQTLREQW